jgi:hypothetical protein
VASRHIEVIYDAALLGADAPPREPDNVTVHARSGDIFVAEDDDDLQLVLLADQFGQRMRRRSCSSSGTPAPRSPAPHSTRTARVST